MSIIDDAPNFWALEEAERLRVYEEACKQILSADEYKSVTEHAELLAKLREDDAAIGVTWPHDTGGLQ